MALVLSSPNKNQTTNKLNYMTFSLCHQAKLNQTKCIKFGPDQTKPKKMHLFWSKPNWMHFSLEIASKGQKRVHLAWTKLNQII